MDERRLIIFVALGVIVALGARFGEPYRSLAAYGSLLALGVTRVIPPLAVVLTAAGGGGAHLAAALSRRRGRTSVMDYVQQKGVRVEEVERDLPMSSGTRGSFRIARGRCTCYSIPRLGNTGPAEWAFLMRTKKDGAQFPNEFLFRADGVEPPAAMAEALARVARGVDDQEYLEFEGSASEIHAFWDAWGGAKQFDRVHRFMQDLAAF
jgi:hypothetical protein